MTDLVTRAQLMLLARTLHVPPERLAHLQRLGARNLHELQDRMSAIIVNRHIGTFQRISKLVPFVPLAISMPLVQRLVPPMMTGRAAGAVGVDHPRKAAETVALLNPSYAADCAPYLDHRTVGMLADIAPPEPVADIVNEMLRRRDYITAGPFLAYATPELIEAVERDVSDDAGLIYSAAFAYSGENISAILRQLLTGPQQRIPRFVRTVLAGPPQLQLAALSVFARCESDVAAAVGDTLFVIGSPAAVGNFVTTAVRAGAVAELLAFADQLSAAALTTLAANPTMSTEAVLAALVGVLAGPSDPASWRGVLALAAHGNDHVQRTVAGLLSGLPEATVAAMPMRATDNQLWPLLLYVVAAGDPDAQARIGRIWATLPPERRAGLQWHLHEYRGDPRLATLAGTIPPTTATDEVSFRRRHRRRG